MARLSFAKPSEERGPYELLPQGTYDVQIDEVDAGRVTKKGNRQMMLKAHVISGAYAGKVVTLFYMIDPPEATWRLKNMLNACGTECIEDGPGELSFDDDDLPGRRFTVEASQEEYPQGSGTMQQRWNREKPFAGDAEAAQAQAQAPQAAPVVQNARPAQQQVRQAAPQQQVRQAAPQTAVVSRRARA